MLYTFYVLYCYYEGLTRSSTMARQVLMYIFYGKYLQKKKNKPAIPYPILHGLHYKTTAGRSRLAKNVRQRFAKFIELSAGKPSWTLMLDDKG